MTPLLNERDCFQGSAAETAESMFEAFLGTILKSHRMDHQGKLWFDRLWTVGYRALILYCLPRFLPEWETSSRCVVCMVVCMDCDQRVDNEWRLARDGRSLGPVQVQVQVLLSSSDIRYREHNVDLQEKYWSS